MPESLTQRQLEVYDLYFNLGYKIRDIANRRGVTYNAVKKIIKKLEKKGMVGRKVKGGFKKSDGGHHGRGFTLLNLTQGKYWRLHDLHLKITPYYFYQRYKEMVNRKAHCFGLWKVHVNKKNVEIQLSRECSFDAKEVDRCLEMFEDDLDMLIPKLEHDIGCEIWKDRKFNIILIRGHLAEVENGIAKIKQDVKLVIFGEDGKVRIIVDKSTGLPELECVHSQQFVDDAKICQDQMGAWLRGAPNNEQLSKNQLAIMESQKVLVQTVNQLATIVSSGSGFGEDKHQRKIREYIG